MIRTADALRNLLLSTEWTSLKMVGCAADVHETVTALESRVKVLEKALEDIIGLAADRKRFVLMGPRGMASCVMLAEKALRRDVPPVPGVEHESDGLE